MNEQQRAPEPLTQRAEVLAAIGSLAAGLCLVGAAYFSASHDAEVGARAGHPRSVISEAFHHTDSVIELAGGGLFLYGGSSRVRTIHRRKL